MFRIKDISKNVAIKAKYLLKDLRPMWEVTIVEEDINLYLLRFIDYIPCSIIINVNEEDIVDLREEIYDLEIWAYIDEEILYKNPSVLTESEKYRKKSAMESMKKYERYAILLGIFSELDIK